MFNSLYLANAFLFLLFFWSITCEQSDVTFTFKEYPYKDSPKNEMTFREYETACEQSTACSQFNGLSRTRCIRECVSPSCYRDLYSIDPIITTDLNEWLRKLQERYLGRNRI